MIQEPNCHKRKCKHFLGILTGKEESEERPICQAFPDGIPVSIAYGPYLHLIKVEGQEGDFVFEKGDSNE